MKSFEIINLLQELGIHIQCYILYIQNKLKHQCGIIQKLLKSIPCSKCKRRISSDVGPTKYKNKISDKDKSGHVEYSRLSRLLSSFLPDEGFVDVRNDTSSCNGCLDQGVQFLVSSNSQLQMPWGDSLHLQIF